MSEPSEKQADILTQLAHGLDLQTVNGRAHFLSRWARTRAAWDFHSPEWFSTQLIELERLVREDERRHASWMGQLLDSVKIAEQKRIFENVHTSMVAYSGQFPIELERECMKAVWNAYERAGKGNGFFMGSGR